MNSIIHSSTTKFRKFHHHHLRHHLHLRRGIDPSSPYYILWHYQILSPDSDIVAHWNHIFLVTCIIALFIDPLYFYLPFIGGPACLTTDTSLKVTITIFRTLADLFYLLHMAMKFRTAFVAPNSRVFGRGELVMDPKEIARRYLRTDFIIDLAATLPLPQASPDFISR